MKPIRTIESRRAVVEAIAITALATAAMFAGAQAVLYSEDDESSERIAQSVLGRSEVITRARRAVTEEAGRVQETPCSDNDLQELKSIAFHSSFITDLGRISERNLTCSALWGDFRALRLREPTFRQGEARVWLSEDLTETPFAGTTLVAQGATFTVSATSAFDGLDPRGTSVVTISLASGHRVHAIRHLGPMTGDEPPSSTVENRLCSKLNGVCVVVNTPRRPIGDVSPWIVLLILGAGVLVGPIGAYILARQRRAQRGSMKVRLNQAVQEDEIQLVYQPLRRIKGHELAGFETLSRWCPQVGEEIPPSVFVPIARQYELTPLLFRHVLSRAMHELGPALRTHPHVYLSVNAEPIDLAQDWLVRYVDGLVKEAGLLPSQIRIEVTEREDLCEAAKTSMGELAQLGYRFLIDDFGTGSANFSHLAQSPFQGIKIDRMFVTAITEDSPLRPVLPGMYQIAQQLGMDVIIEGVETADQVALLRDSAPNAVGQGWYYGYPLPLADTLLLLDHAPTSS